jgi:putative addiction module component (TIGR02574 family)
MMKTKKLIQEARSLPVEEKALMVDSLLKSLHMPDTTIDAKWAEVAKRRLQELRSGKVKPIPGDLVFSEILGLKLFQVSKNDGYDLIEEISPHPFLA